MAVPKAATTSTSSTQKPASRSHVSKTASSSLSGPPPSMAHISVSSKPGDVTTADDSSPLIKVKAKSVKVAHHGLRKYKNLPKGRHCVCPMCRQKFTDSTRYIKHYSETHPPLPCQDCPKVFSNPLSLQKHRYHHTGQQLKCDKCAHTFPFESQLRDHRKAHFKRKPHRCSFPNCDAEATHLYDMKKHECVHLKKKHKCPSCEYTTLDARYLNQHKKCTLRSTHTNVINVVKLFGLHTEKKASLLNIQKTISG